MRVNPIDINQYNRAARSLANDVLTSPLRKYVVYSILLHVLVVGLFSINMVLPERAVAEESGEEAARTTEPSEPAEAAEAANASQATGEASDYYQREGIDTTPAAPEEIPENPMEIEDDLLEGLE